MPYNYDPEEPHGAQVHRRLADDARGWADDMDQMYEDAEDAPTRELLANGINKALDFLNDIQTSFYKHARWKKLPLLHGDDTGDEEEALDRGAEEETDLLLDGLDEEEGADVLDRRKKVLNAVKAYLDDLSPDDMEGTTASMDDLMGMMGGQYGDEEDEDDLGMGMPGGRQPFSAPDGKPPGRGGKPLPKKLHAHKCRKDLEGVSEELDDDPQTKQLLEDIAQMLEEFLSQGAPSEPTFEIDEEHEDKIKDHKKHLALACKKYGAMRKIENYRRGKRYHDSPEDDQGMEGMEGLGFEDRLGKHLQQQRETSRQLKNMADSLNSMMSRMGA